MTGAMVAFLVATSVMFAMVVAYPQWAWVSIVVWLGLGVYVAGDPS